MEAVGPSTVLRTVPLPTLRAGRTRIAYKCNQLS
jgi:hypothetical protein